MFATTQNREGEDGLELMLADHAALGEKGGWGLGEGWVGLQMQIIVDYLKMRNGYTVSAHLK